jgi:phosphohistidine swiveling domain-containing protein
VLPGVATPLTWSALAGFAEQGFREALGALGCKVPKGARLLGSFRGRIYLNLSELEGITAQVPGLRSSHLLLAKSAAKALARVEQPVLGAHDVRRGNILLRLPGVASRLASAHLGFEQRYARFESAFAFERARIDRLDLRILPGAALDETLSDVERLLGNTGALLAQAYGGLVAALLPLRSALALLAPSDAPAVQSALLSAIEDMESAGSGREILSVARAFGSDPVAREKLIAGVSSMAEIPAGPAFAALERLLDRYGHRAVREVELAEPRWRENPRFLFDAVRMQLLHEAHGHDAQAILDRRVEVLREQADAALRKLPAPFRPALRGVLSVVRRYVRRREELRSQIAHVLGMFRRIALDASRRMLVREPELGADPAFMLTTSELHAFLRGELRSVRALTLLRRRQFARDLGLPDPPDTFVGYPPPPALQAPMARAERLRGLAASAGQVEGRVCVLHSPDASMEPGDILVVPAADVGWTPLFVAAGGLVSELGGPLSHVCVVAREYGLPAVVSVRSATSALKTGDRVRLDASLGTVELIGHA